MDTEEDETHHVPNVDSSVQLEDTPVTTATPSELQNQNTESILQLEPLSVSNESGAPAQSALSPVSEKGVVDAEVVSDQASEAAVAYDSTVSKVKHEILDVGIEGDDVGDSHVAGEKAYVLEDVSPTANLTDEVLKAEGIEVSVEEVTEERRIADVVEVDGETAIISVKEEINVAEKVDGPTEQTAVMEGREVDDPTEQTAVMEEREVADVSVKRELLVEEQQVDAEVEQSGIMEKTGVDSNMAEESDFFEKHVKGETSEQTGGTHKVLNVSEQTENVEAIHPLKEIGTDMTEADQKSVMEDESDKAEDKRLENVVEDVEKADGTATEVEDPVMEEEPEKAEDTELENVVEGVATELEVMTEAEDPVMEEESEKSEDPVMEDESEKAEDPVMEEESEKAEDPVMEEESEKAEDTMLENVVEDVEKAEGAATEAEDPVREEESRKAEYIKLENVVGDVENAEVTATEMEYMTEAEEDLVIEEESEKAEDTELENVAEDVESAEETATEMEDTAEVTKAADDTEMEDTAEVTKAADDTDMLHMTEELETEAAEETEDTKDIEDDSKVSGGKRKRGKKQSNKVLAKGPSRKKAEEDVCFICFDGGDLVLCDRRGCPKAYHPACVGRDEAFFQTKGKWNCGWHLCSNCKKNANYMCYTCTFSLCKGCIKDAVILCLRGNKGFCESCMNFVMLIERKEQAQVDFEDRGSWEYLFKDYWIDLKGRLSITSDELAQAKNPWKGAAKQESPNELHGFNDAGGSGSDSSSGNVEVTISKRRKTRSQSKARAREGDSPSTMASSGEGASTDENAEWASRELLEVVMNMRNGNKSVLSRMELSQLILDYIQKYKLRDRHNKSYVICDTRLKNLFGKPRVGHIEMLNLLDPHIFFTKEDSQTDDFQGSVVDAEANQLEADWNADDLTKTGKDKKRKTRKKGDARGLQSNIEDYAAIDMHNINLIYLRRNLVEELLEDTETFHDKVVDCFVRIRISGAGQKQDLYRLVQVVGTSKVAEPYRVGKRTTDFLLDILNLNKTEAISIDIISNQEFTEDECKRLRQSIKCGLINRLTVGDIQEKATTIQSVRVKDWLESETTRLSHLRDRASDLGRRKELRECVEKLQILKTPEELQRRLEEIPEIHVDAKMDPSYESEEDEEDDKKQDNYVRPRGSGFSRRGREPMSPRKGVYSSTDSWSGSRNSSSLNRGLSRTPSSKGFTSKGDDSLGASEMGNDTLWNLGRERERQSPNSWNKQKTALSSETGTRNTHSVVIQEPSLKVLSEISPATPSMGVPTSVQINETEKIWHYKDPSSKVQGPFSIVQLRKWSNTGYFPDDLKIWRANETQDDSILLTNALAGKFEKDPPVADNSLPKAQMALYGSSLGATAKQGMESHVGERSRFDQHHVAWSPQHVLGSPGQSGVENWKTRREIGSSTVRSAPSSIDIPKHSQDTWDSGTNLPSPTPNQIPAGGNKGQAFEGKWSPTPAQSSGSFPIANPFRGGAAGLQPPTVVSESGSLAAPGVNSHTMGSTESHRRQVNAQASVNLGADMKNAVASIQNLVQSMSSYNPSDKTHGPGSVSVSRQEAVSVSSIPATGTQSWGNASTQKLEPNPSLAMPAQPAGYGHWNDASQSGQHPASFSTGNPTGVFPTPGQPTMMPSDSWRPAAPVQSNVQLPVPPNLPWGMAVADNQGAAPRQAPGNLNPGWGPMPGNQNMGWGAPVPANTNVNWGASGQGAASVIPNQNWAAPGQRQVPGTANSGWTGPGNTIQGWTPAGQVPTVNTNSGWVATGQGAALGTANPGYAAPSRNSGMRGSEPNHNGDKFTDQRERSSQGGESGFGGVKPWNRQSSFGSGGGSARPPFRGQRVCKYHESGHCKKGASCDYMHT